MTPCTRDRIRLRHHLKSWAYSETLEDHNENGSSSIVSGLMAWAGPASAQSMEHTILGPQDVKWTKAPTSLPPGAEASVLYGDAGKEGLFVLRLKLPKGYAIPPHTHPKPEIVTVISGTLHSAWAKLRIRATPSRYQLEASSRSSQAWRTMPSRMKKPLFRSTALGHGVSIT